MEIQQKPHVTPKDFFLWLAGMATLYVSAISFITLLFQYIEYIYPDQLLGYVDPYSGSIRYAIASLIVIFPLYIYLTRLLNKDLRLHPEKRELWVRKWLIYLTLFVAGVTITVDLITLINTFLGGDITMRFVLKVLVVLVVIGAGFFYYLADLRGRWERREKESRMYGGIALAIVLVSIIGGFFIIGSPTSQRFLRYDAQKVSDLQNIQWQLVSFWQQKQKLPATLEDLEDPIQGFIAPRDPQTGESYSYNVTGVRSFELCATFNRESRAVTASVTAPRAATPIKGVEDDVWTHTVGNVCFERTIDPERYPPFTK